MKNKINNTFFGILSFIFLSIFLSGCKKFLAEPYDNRLPLNTVESFRGVLAAAFPGRHEMFTDIMTDDYQYYPALSQASISGYFLPYYQWLDLAPDNNFTGASTAYQDYYASIYRANLVIHGVLNAGRGTQQEKEALLGEALVLRAYCHFMLVNIFGLHYDKATASTDLGTTIVTNINEENTREYLRSSVEETYQQIEKDAKEGIDLMEKNTLQLSQNPYHFSLPSAYALMSRLKLYKGEWEESVQYSDKVIALKGRIVRDMEKDLEVISRSGSGFFTIGYMDPSTHDNILLAVSTTSIGFVIATGYSLSGFFLNDTIGAVSTGRSSSSLFNRNDLRSRLIESVGTVIDRVTVCMKYESLPNNPRTTSQRATVFGMEEVLLNRAESIMRSTRNQEEALKDLNVLRQYRYNNYQPINAGDYSDENLLDLILLERRKEFINEGMRWFDIKRLKLPISKPFSRGGEIMNLSKNDLRKALQIPLLTLQGNPNIQLNPR